MKAIALWVTAAALLATACGSDDDISFGTSGAGASNSSSSGAGGDGSGASGSGGDASGSGGDASGSGGAGGGAGEVVSDPDADGPYTVTILDDTVTVPATGSDVPIHCAYPTGGPAAGPYPVVVIAHGFQLPASQYYGYVTRLASHGYVALTADFPAGFTGASHVRNAQDVLGALDWAAQAPELAGIADADNAGMTGHSLGGKAALLAATLDPRVRATITLDPVDTSGFGCDPADCPDVSAMMPLDIPTGFLGETTDAAGGFQPCAPAADNYQTFYAGTTAPSLEVTVNGANHMSFLDDVASCGFNCSICQMPTAENATVNSLSRAYVVAFYQRHLKGIAAYDTYLTGAEAQARYVEPGLISIQSK